MCVFTLCNPLVLRLAIPFVRPIYALLFAIPYVLLPYAILLLCNSPQSHLCVLFMLYSLQSHTWYVFPICNTLCVFFSFAIHLCFTSSFVVCPGSWVCPSG